MKSLVATLLLALLGSTASAAEQRDDEPRIEAEVQVRPTGSVSDEERRATYLAAGRVLKHVNQARAALSAKNRDEAKQHINQAILLTNIIRASLPKYDVTARISAGELVYEDREQVQDVVVPIFDELERAAILSPVKAAQSDSVDKELEEGSAVVNVDLIQTRAELNIETSRNHLDAALAAIKARKFEQADDRLAAIQNSVRLTRIEVDLPLERARSNLMLARDRFDDGQHKDAQLALRVAIDALLDYKATAQSDRQADVARLLEEMGRVEANQPADASQVRDKLDAWWNLLSGW